MRSTLALVLMNWDYTLDEEKHPDSSSSAWTTTQRVFIRTTNLIPSKLSLNEHPGVNDGVGPLGEVFSSGVQVCPSLSQICDGASSILL